MITLPKRCEVAKQMFIQYLNNLYHQAEQLREKDLVSTYVTDHQSRGFATFDMILNGEVDQSILFVTFNPAWSDKVETITQVFDGQATIVYPSKS